MPKRWLILMLLLPLSSYSQSNTSLKADTLRLHRQRLTALITGSTLLYAGSMTGLYHLWYKDYPQSSFHFYNDNDEWLGVDKAGHATASYIMGSVGYESLRWAGVDEKNAIWFGGSVGFMFLTVVETLDGFSAEWGASPGDLIANGLGSALFISQQLGWKEQRLKLKWSFHLTKYAQYRPNLLGSTFPERMLKDYNGQTIWLSGNIHSFLPTNSRFPAWLNVAVGYGAEGMIGATSNPDFYNGQPLPHFDRYAQFYLAPDIDLSRIKTNRPALKTLLKVLDFIKIPLPGLVISEKGVQICPVCF
ncbi:MAG: YfiM family protein [Lentimicrobium sp.]|nr:YfiM family protein [Lentimicrobium sp.]